MSGQPPETAGILAADGVVTARAARDGRAQVGIIAGGVGMASFSTSFWMPFLPLYLIQLGAASDARALFWLAVALSGQGAGRIVSGPFWGVIADRYGRKPMYVRALYAASLTTVVAGLARTPWHVAVALTLQGLLSGFTPAAIALTSVVVPRERLSSGLATVTAVQYLGTTLGPALGALLALVFGLRGAMFAGAMLPSLAALLVTLRVERDPTAPRAAPVTVASGAGHRRLHQLGTLLSLELGIALLLYFVLYATNQVVRVATPLALRPILHGGSLTAATGIAFTAAGVGSVIGAFGLTRLLIRPRGLRRSLTVVIAVTAIAHLLLARADSVLLFTLWFALISVMQGAMIPATNTLIATSVSPERRGTAFGIASSVQAAAFVFGPLSAAIFAGFSLAAGFAVLGGLFLATGIVVFKTLKEPDLAGP